MSLQSTDPIADLLTRIRNAALVGKSIFHTQAEGFFMTMNCLLVADILMRISWPVIMKMMQYLENFGGLFPGGF